MSKLLNISSKVACQTALLLLLRFLSLSRPQGKGKAILAATKIIQVLSMFTFTTFLSIQLQDLSKGERWKDGKSWKDGKRVLTQHISKLTNFC